MKQLLVVAPLAVIAMTATLCSCTDTSQATPCPQQLPLTQVTAKDAQLLVEIAASESARQCGLANRDTLATASGMLFVYNDDAIRAFWMKDTQIPLAIAFIDQNRNITQIRQMQPLPADRVYRSQEPVRYALETVPGWFAANGITPGTKIDFRIPADITVEDTAQASPLARWLQMLF